MRKTPLALAAAALVVSVTAVGTSAAPTGRFRPAVTVGSDGNEPLIRSAPDGTLYVSALQHLYVSTDSGRHWAQSAGSPYSTTLNQNSDSSIQVDAKGRLYMTFDWPYAGATAVCTSDDRAKTMQCNPAVVPGGTDRMWLAVKDPSTSYLVTNEGLYQTIFGVSSDRGSTYLPRQTTAATVADPTDGPLLVSPKTGKVVQPIIDNLTNATATDNFQSGTGVLRVFDPSATAVPADVVTYPIPLTAGGALPGAAYGRDGTLYVTAEKAIVGNGGKIAGVGVQVARSRDDGKTWTVLPMIPGTTTGTSTFVALGAGKAGHVGLIFYRARVAGNPGTVPASTHWDAVFAESTDALSAHPHWTMTTVDKDVHIGVICATAGCVGNGRFAGDFLDASFDAKDRPQIVWMRNLPGNSTDTQIRYTTVR
ncbi:MAG: hypothetical protein QOC82_1995 [Frankiaceae bacterium]|nr:hypothetical protein [Frankiaceae bacterium]